MAGKLRFDVSATNSARGEFLESAAELEQVARQLRKLDGQTARTKLEVNGGAAATATIEKVAAQLRALPTETKTTVHVDVDRDAPSRLTQLAELAGRVGTVSGAAATGVSKLRSAAQMIVDPSQLPIIERASDFIANKYHRAVELARPAVERLGKVSEQLEKSIGALSLAGGAVKVISGLGTSLVELSGVAALAPAVILGVGVAFTTAKLATLGFSDALTGSAKKQAEAYAKMGPEARKLVDTLRELGPAANEFRRAVQDAAVNDLNDGIRSLAGTYLPILKTGLTGVATGYNTMAYAAIKALQSSTAIGQVRTIVDNTSTAVGRMGASLANAVLGFLRLGAAGSGWLPKMADAIDRAAERFNAWSIRITMDGSFDQWVAKGVIALTQLGVILGNVGAIATTVFSALDGSGVGLLATLAALTTQLRAFLQSAQGAAALQSLARVLAAAGDAAQRILAEALKQLGPLLSALAPLAIAFAAAIGDHLVEILHIVGPLLTQLAQLLASNAPLLHSLATAAAIVAIGFGPMVAIIGLAASILKGLLLARIVSVILGELGLAGTIAGRVLQALVSPLSLIRGLAPLIAQGLGMLAAQLGIMAGPIGALIVGFALLYSTSSQFRDAVNALAGVVGSLFVRALQQAGEIISSTVVMLQTFGSNVAAALSGLVDFGSKVAGVFGPAGKVIGDFLTGLFGTLGKMPGVALAALAAFLLFSRIAPIFALASTAVAGFSARLLALQSSSAIANAAATGIGRAAGVAATALSKMGAALPIVGVALIALGAIFDAVGPKATQMGEAVLAGQKTLEQAINEEAQRTLSRLIITWDEAGAKADAYRAATESVTAAMQKQYDALSPFQKLQADVAMAQATLNDAVAKYGPASEQARAAGLTLAAAQDRLKTAQQGAADAAKTHSDRLKELADQMASQVGAALAYEQAVRRTAEAQEEANAALSKSGAKSKEYQDAVLSLAQSMSSQADAARRQAEAFGGVEAGASAYNIELMRSADLSTQAGRDAFIKIAAGMDDAGRAALSAAAKASGLRTEIITLPNGKTITVVVEADQGKLPEVKSAAESFAAKKYVGAVTVTATTDLARNAILQTVQLADGTKATIKISGDGSPALLTVGQTKYTIDSTTGTLKVLGDVAPGEASLEGFRVKVDASTGRMTIEANTAPADAKTDATKIRMDTSIGTMTIDGNPTLANGKITTAVKLADGSTGTLTIDGNPDPATGKITATIKRADGSTGTVTIDGNNAKALAAVRAVIALASQTVTMTIRQVVEKVTRSPFARGGIAHAASGLVLGGYAPGRDTVPAMLSPGEGVAVPQLVKEIGASRFLAANAAALAGGSGMNALTGGRGADVMSMRRGSGAAPAAWAGLAAVSSELGQLRAETRAQTDRLAKVIGSARPLIVEDHSGNPTETGRAAALALRL